MRSLRKVAYETTHRGTRLRVVLDDPPGNVLDEVMLEDLARCLSEHGARKELRCVTLEGKGKNFSFGASIAEHRREHAPAMLARMAGLARQLLSLNVATQAIVRGQCLGGGLELALCCSRIVASPGAKLGQPESKLGVFAPIASMLLRERVGQAVAEDLLLSGRAIGARAALTYGLVEEVAADPGAGAVKYFSAHLKPKSAAALRFVVDASRRALRASVFPALAELESVYVEQLMATHDANEGVAAFLEKRAPRWRDA